ncbi:MAG: helix-turn-helix domain-containing protein [Candidatus Omnitrophica bacterium]|nr:helix-turn-helix domain-containing protein [Candidatus Omnitrophota bacterium]
MESIGRDLRVAREKKGISLDDASSQTKIHRNILEALEKGTADEMLSPTYVKSFLKQYCLYLGINPEPALARYTYIHPEGAPQELIIRPKETSPKIDMTKLLFPVVAVLVCAVVVSLAYYGLTVLKKTHLLEKKKKQEIVVSRQEVPRVPKEALKPEPAKKVKAVEPVPAPPKNEPIILTVRATKDVWLQVKSDGKKMFEEVLKEGSSEKWEANEKIELWVGKAEGLELERNGQPLGSLGYGIIKNILITREDMKIHR